MSDHVSVMMKKEIILERVGQTTRAAVLENGQLCEYYSGCGGKGSLAGNVYMGRVQNVLPGMNSAFVDIGLNKNAYISADDFPAKCGEHRIEKLVRPGQLLLCQVIKEPGGSKGPRISANISLPGRLCAILPDLKYTGVSKKIEDPETRDRLYEAASALTEETGIGIIVRTAAEQETASALREDYLLAVEQWNQIRRAADVCPGPKLLYADRDIILFTIRELLNDDVERVLADGEELASKLKETAEKVTPALVDRISAWTGDIPLFDVMRVDTRLDEALERTVHLSNGGTLVIDETEAMTVIDVNTGRFTGKRDMEETIERTNREAAVEIARQMRLRDLGGVIIIDFIDMISKEPRDALLALMRELTATDRVHTDVVEITALGLMEITRKKVRQPLSKRMLKTCRTCHGSGRELRPEETALRCQRDLMRRRRGGDTSGYLVKISKAVLNAILQNGWAEDEKTVFCIDEDISDYRILPTAAEK